MTGNSESPRCAAPATPAAAVTPVPLLEAMVAYERKGVGVDMLLKSFLGVFRLLMLYSPTSAGKKKYAQIVDSIIECRMLCNFGRPTMTFYQGMKHYQRRSMLDYWYWLFLCLSYFFRVFEQVSGDLGYLQKVVFSRWSREKLSFYYRFFKSLSLTCCLLMEIVHRPQLHKRLQEASTSDQKYASEMDVSVSNALIVRTLCDMYVYFKWIPAYTPVRTIEYACGSVSGVIGVWLVWRDVRCCCKQKASACSSSATPGSAGAGACAIQGNGATVGRTVSAIESGGDGPSGDEG